MMKKSLLHSIPYWLLIPVLHGVFCLTQVHPSGPEELWTWATLFLVVACSSTGLFTDERPYSLNRMFWLFVLVVFGLVPSLQIYIGRFPWDGALPVPTLLRSNIVVLLFMAGYQLAVWIASAVAELRLHRFRKRVDGSFVRSFQTLGMGLLIVLLLGYTVLLGLKNIWLKGQIDIHWGDRVSSATYLLIEKLVRGPVLYLMLLGILLFRLRRIGLLSLVLVLAAGFWINFPLAMPRYLAAAVCGGVLLSFGGRLWLERRQVLSWLLLACWLLLYPFAGLSRWEAPKGMRILKEEKMQVLTGAFVSGDFDSYATLARTIVYTQQQGHTGGRQLGTSALFFVPRKYWPGKSIGSGALVYKSLGSRFTNMASPLPAEGYIDFGWPGAFVYAFVIGLVATLYDRYYWYWRLHRAAEGDYSFRCVMYPAALFLFFFLLRGDLLSSLAAIAGLWATAWLAQGLLRIRPARN